MRIFKTLAEGLYGERKPDYYSKEIDDLDYLKAKLGLSKSFPPDRGINFWQILKDRKE